MNEKDIKDAIKQRIADKIQDACDGENIADAIMSNEQNQDFIDTNEQDKVQDMQNEAQIEKDVKDEKEDKETTNREIGKFKNPEELLRAYGLLEKEFTKKSQRLKELENAIATPFKTEEDWKVAVDKFFERTPSAKPFAKESRPQTRQKLSGRRARERAFGKVQDARTTAFRRTIFERLRALLGHGETGGYPKISR